MAAIKMKVDIRKVIKNLDKMEKRLPYIMSDTLNNLAWDSRSGIQKGLPHWLKLTKAFIPRQVIVEQSNPKTLLAKVGFNKRLHQVGNMLKTSHGAIRIPYKGTHIAVPIGVKRNARGGITKQNRPENLLKKPNYFEAKIRGRLGIWKRNTKAMKRKTGYSIALMYVLVDRTRYTGGDIELIETVNKVVKRRYLKYARKNIARELNYMRNNR